MIAKYITAILFLALITLFICIANPTMHKSLVITDTGMQVVDKQLKTQSNNVQLQPVKQTSVNTPKTNVKPVSMVKEVKPKTVPSQTNVKPQVKQPVKVQSKPQAKQTVVQTKTVQSKPNQKPAASTQVKKPVPQTAKTTVQTPAPKKVLTEQEETILWNKWHSNLQNRIISDTTARLKNLDSYTKQAINGTLYIVYSFNVSKSGAISNLSVKTNISNEASVRVNSIVSGIISGYGGTSIVTFPNGTSRVSEKHKGAISTVIKDAKSTTYSNTSDYNRYNETVKK